MRIWLLSGFIIFFLKYSVVFSQATPHFTLPDSLNPIALHSTKEGYLYLFDRYGIYELSGGQWVLHHLLEKPLDRNSLTFNNDSLCLMGSSTIGFYEFSGSSGIEYHALPANHAKLIKMDKQRYLLSGQRLYAFENKAWRTIDQKKHEEALELSNYQNNSVIFFKDNTVLKYSENETLDTLLVLDEGLAIKSITKGIHAYYFATDNYLFKGTIQNNIFIISGRFHFTEKLNALKILELGHNLIIQDPLKIVKVDTSMNKPEEVIASNAAEWIDIEPYTDKSFWALSTENVELHYLEKNKHIKRPHTGNFTPPYTIRQTMYISDGQNVYQWNNAESKWQVDLSKSAPKKIINDSDGNPVLVFEDRLIKIDRTTALVIDYFEFGRKLLKDYLIKDQNSYLLLKGVVIEKSRNAAKEINVPEEASMLASSIANVYLLSDSTVYVLKEELFQKEYTHSMPIKEIAASGSMLFILDSNNQLGFYDTLTEEFTGGNQSGQKVYDLIEADNSIFALSRKSLIKYNPKNSATGGNQLMEIYPLIELPLQSELLTIDNQTAWFTSQNELINIPFNASGPVQHPQVRIECNRKDKVLKVYHNNHWTENVKFNYYMSGGTSTEALWTSSNSLDYESLQKDFNTVTVSMTDDLFGANNSSASIRLPLITKAINPLLYLLLLIIIFAFSFGGLRLIRQ